MNIKKTVYIRALLWALDKGSDGFTIDELKAAITNDEREQLWIQRMLLGEINGEPLIFHMGTNNRNRNGEYVYYLTGSGTAKIIDYLKLEDAKNASKKAEQHALWAFCLTVFTLLVSIVIGVYQIWSTFMTQESLKITKQILKKEQDPMIKYEYTREEFKANANENILIKKVDWILIMPNRIKINEFGNNLTILNLKNSLLFHIGEGKRIKFVKNFIDCYILGSEFYQGIPMIVAVEFRRQGSTETFTQIDLIRIRRSEREGLYVYIEKPGVNINEVNQFVEESKQDFEMYKKFLDDYKQEGKCDIYFETPPKDFW